MRLLCYHSSFYLSGLLCSLYSHKKLKPNNVELVVMCDSVIYEYKDIIKDFCDQIFAIDMFEIPGVDKTYKENTKYAQPWMNYIINKWQCLKFEKYKKILLLDIDILPVKKSLYMKYLKDIILM